MELSGWFLNSGATRPMCGDRSQFSDLRKSPLSHIRAADNKLLSVQGEGTIYMSTSIGKSFMLINVLYVPGIAANLVSVGCIDQKGDSIQIKNRQCNVFSPKNELIMTSSLAFKGIYKLNLRETKNHTHLTPMPLSFVANPLSIDIWHKRLAHINPRYLQVLQKQVPTSINFAK